MRFQWITALLLAAGMQWMQAAAPPGQTTVKNDNAEVFYHLGLNYYHGLGDKPDYARALKNFHKAAELGLAKAQGMIGQCHLNGRGVPRDPRQAAVWLTKATTAGDMIAQFNLATLYTAGEGVPKNPAHARQLYLKAAAQGHTAAMANIGVLHETGMGVKQDFAEAYRWYKMAAKPGLPTAQCNLGQLYATGRGVPADLRKAAEWYQKAADQNYAQAQFLLSTAYYFGHGVEKDWAKAYQWIILAAAGGHAEAKQHERTIGEKLTPNQLKAAAQAVKEFTAKLRGKTIESAEANTATGTGFYVTTGGHVLTSHSLIANAKKIEIRTATANHVARVVKTDPANDLALLHVNLPSQPLHLGIGRAVAPGEPVFTIGFPGQKPGAAIESKLTAGKLRAITSANRDPRLYQVSVPMHTGNLGGALVADAGYAIGMIAAHPGEAKLPHNFNHALKSTQIVAFLTRIPEAAAKVPLGAPKKMTYSQAIGAAQMATVLIWVQR